MEAVPWKASANNGNTISADAQEIWPNSQLYGLSVDFWKGVDDHVIRLMEVIAAIITMIFEIDLLYVVNDV